MIRRLLVAIAAGVLAPAVLATGAVSANQNDVRVDCAGLRFSMPRGEVGTVVTVTVNGATVRSSVIARQNDPLAFTIASPDQTAPAIWSVLVDSQWRDGETWRTFTQPACTTSTTAVPATTAAPATTVPATTSTTAVPATTAPPATTVPATASTTVITTPRPGTVPATAPPATAPTTSVPTVWRLPDTGPNTRDVSTGATAAMLAGIALVIAATRRRSPR